MSSYPVNGAPTGIPPEAYGRINTPPPTAYAPHGPSVGTFGQAGWNPATYSSQPPMPGPYDANGGAPPERLPTYTETVRAKLENSLLPFFTVMQIICIILAAILFISHILNAVDFASSKALQYVAAILFIVCFAIHLFLLVAMSSLRTSMTIVYLVALSMAVALVAQIISVAQLYRDKTPSVEKCLNDSGVPQSEWHTSIGYNRYGKTGDTYWDACNARWNGYVVWNIAWLVGIVIISPCFCIIAYKCYQREAAAAYSQRMTGPSDGWGNESFAMTTVPPYDPSTDPLTEQERRMVDAKLDYPDPDSSSIHRETR
ncbi:hypothetical protein MCUN1_003657 [Malassezia cuniculi]|uniref:MARVEL domain-containing protein n=1 Tax=Malassezia cuniculi TaxID=948313 RepID=A0AAF0EXD3_9BASI|nr:hypothetical protein MCUN1_003657 [Malassezia cuniculi]